MPDVGVLELTIRDNSTTAAGGLNELAGALRAVKRACNSGLGLDKVASEVVNLAKTIQAAKGTSTIVKNLGTMFNAINKFSKLKGFNLNADELRDYARSFSQTADSLERMNKAKEAAAGDKNFFDTMIGGGQEKAVNTIKKTAETFEEQYARLSEVTGAWKSAMRTQLFSSGPTSRESSSNTKVDVKELQKQTEGLVQTKEIVQEATAAEREAYARTKNAIEETTEAQIKLNSAGEAYAGSIKIFDSAIGAYKQMYVDAGNVEKTVSGVKAQTDDLNASMQKAIDLSQVPASGAYGTFANASEEITHFKKKIEEAELSMQQFNDIVMSSEKQMKYGGPINQAELQLNIQHGTEGYFKAEEAAELYRLQLEKVEQHASLAAESIRRAASETESFASSVNNVDNAANRTTESVQTLSSSVSVAAAQAAVNSAAIQRIFDALNNPPQFRTADYISQAMNIGGEVKSAEDSFRAFIDLLGQETPQSAMIRELNPEMANLRQQLDAAGISAGQFTSKLVDVDGELKQKKPDTEEAAGAMDKFKETLGDLKKGIQNMFPTLTSLFKSFLRMAKMRAIRYIIRQIAAAFKEGTKNVYEYSKAIGSTFHESMDSAASSLAQMKNAIGAQLAPLLQMLIPVLQRVVNWFINVTNVVNQFFSLLNGQKTWTRALPQTVSAFDKQTKAAKSASAAMKDLLADWDELNIIQSESGGSGGGAGTTAAEDYLNMFEEVDTFDNKIKDIVGWIQEHMELVKGIVKAIGLGILAWKVSKAFSGTLATLGTILAGVALVITGIELGSAAGKSAGSKGYFDTGDTMTAIGGMIASALGGALIGFKLGGAYGAAIGFLIGFGIAAYATIQSFAVENKARQIRLKWGNSNYSPEALKIWAQEQFTFDIEGRINSMNFVTDESEAARTQLETSINTFVQSLDLAKAMVGLDIDKEDKEQTYKDLQESANEVIKGYNSWLAKDQELVAASLKVIPQIGDGTDGSASELLEKITIGNKTLKQYMTDLGKEIAEAYNQGVINNWGNGTEEAYLEQLERLNKITQRQNEYTKNRQLQDEQVRIENMSYEDFGTAMDDVREWKNNYIESAEQMYNELYKNQVDKAGAASAMLEDLEERYAQGKVDAKYYESKKKDLEATQETAEKLAETYYAIIQDVEEWLEGTNENGGYNDPKYRESMDLLREKIIEVLRGTEGYDFFDTDGYDIELAIAHEGINELYYNNNKAEALSKLLEFFDSLDYVNSENAQNAMQEYGISKYEAMNEEQISGFLEFLRKYFDEDFVKGFINQIDISNETRDKWLSLMPQTESKMPTDKDVQDTVSTAMGWGMLQGSLFPARVLNERLYEEAMNNTNAIAEDMARIREDVGTIADNPDFDYEKQIEDTAINEAEQFAQLSETYDKVMEAIRESNLDNAWEYTMRANDMFAYQDFEGLKNLLDDLGQYNTTEQTMEMLKKDILNAVVDGLLDYEDLQNLIEKYQSDKMLEQALQELNLNLDEEGYLIGPGTGRLNPERMKAFNTSISDVGWGNGVYYPSGNNQEMTDQDISKDVETGTRMANEAQNMILQDIAQRMLQLLQKQWVVNINPSSTMGALVNSSVEKFRMIAHD